MSRSLLVLRPAPGAAVTAARVHAAGLSPILLPLFTITPLVWSPPPGRFDALLLTSANAVRHGGGGLAALRGLPVIAVGMATAEAARAAGLTVVATGDTDGAAALRIAQARGYHRILRLTADRPTPLAGIVDVAVYTTVAIDHPPGAVAEARGAIALLHSSRAAERFRMLLDSAAIDPADVRVAALSTKVANAAGAGWRDVIVAATPNDAALVAAAATHAIDR